MPKLKNKKFLKMMFLYQCFIINICTYNSVLIINKVIRILITVIILKMYNSKIILKRWRKKSNNKE